MAAAVGAFAVTAAVLPPVVNWLQRRALLDRPTARSSHVEPTPRGGGIGVLAGVAAGSAVAWCLAGSDLAGGASLGVLVGTSGGAMIGLVEDLHGVAPWRRLAAQGVVASGVVTAAWTDGGVEGWMGHPLAVVAAVVWFVGMVNVVNFMDGINGITAVTTIVVASYDIWLGWRFDDPLLIAAGAIFVGAAMAFLPFNFPRARVFLGDSGSYLSGAGLASLALVALVRSRDPFIAGAPLLYYLGDASLTLVARVRAGEAIMTPHRAHAYQKRVRGGRSHASVTVEVGAVTLATSVAGVAAELLPAAEPAVAVVAVAATGVYIVRGRRTEERIT